MEMSSFKSKIFVILSFLDVGLFKIIVISLGTREGSQEDNAAIFLLLTEDNYVNIRENVLTLATFEFVYIILAILPQLVISIVCLTTGSSLVVIGIICLIFKIVYLFSYLISLARSPALACAPSNQ